MKLTPYAAACLVFAGFIFPAQAQQAKPPQPTLKDIPYASDHEVQKLDVYQANSDQPSPVIVYIHGGGWRAGTKDKVPAFLVNAWREGWLSVVSVEYRFTDVAIHPAQVEDCRRAVQFVRSKAREWNLAPEKIAVCGGSAGAHLSLWLALHDDAASPEAKDPVERESSRVTCVIGYAGPTDWNLLGEIPHAHPAYRQLLGYEPGTPTEEMAPEKIAGVSPITYASKDDPPVLLVHGDADVIVPIQHARVLHDRLKQKGAESELFVVEGGRHNVAGAGGPTVVERSLAFIKEHLVAPKEPAPESPK